LLDLHRKLEKLAETYPIALDGPLLLKDKELDLGANEPKVDLNEGIKFHQMKDYENAWDCFEENAKLGNPIAKYWQGYYLYNGYLKIDKELAYKLFKEVADDNDIEEYQGTVSDDQYQNAISDAPYRYAVSLLNDASKRVENRDKIIHYLELAKENNNPEAMYLLGDIYVNGKLQMEKDIKLGLEYLNLTLKHNGPSRGDAINLLKKFSEKS
ncbi:10281_t:CDS:1, partial [Dentiscutata heterogama]